MVRRSLLIALAALAASATPAAAAVTVSNPTVTEGGQLSFDVTSDTPGPVAVTTQDGTAKSGEDYTAVDDSPVFVLPGDTRTVTVQTTQDTRPEPDETVILKAGDAQGTGTIENDDVPTLSVDDVTVGEKAGTARLTITTQATSDPVSFDFATAPGSATSPDDFTSASGSRTIAPGATTATVDVPIADDTQDEPDESFTLTLTNPNGATLAKDTGTVTITSDDIRLLAIGDVSVTEGDGDAVLARIPIRISAPTFRTVSFRWATADGSAKAPGDYLARLATATIPPGESQTFVEVPVVSDEASEGAETFGIALSNVQGASAIKPTGVVSITDDDNAGAPAGRAAGADLTPPDMRLDRPALSGGRFVKVLVGCPAGETRCRGRVTLYTRADGRAKGRAKALRTERRIGSRAISLPGQATQTLRIAIPAALRSAARVRGRLVVGAYLLARDAAGNVETRVSSGTLRMRTAKKKTTEKTR